MLTKTKNATVKLNIIINIREDYADAIEIFLNTIEESFIMRLLEESQKLKELGVNTKMLLYIICKLSETNKTKL